MQRYELIRNKRFKNGNICVFHASFWYRSIKSHGARACSLATNGTQEITERTEIIPSQAKSLSLTDDTDCTDGSLLWRELGPAEIAEMAERFIAADAAGCCKRSGCFFYAAAIDGEGHNP